MEYDGHPHPGFKAGDSVGSAILKELESNLRQSGHGILIADTS